MRKNTDAGGEGKNHDGKEGMGRMERGKAAVDSIFRRLLFTGASFYLPDVFGI